MELELLGSNRAFRTAARTDRRGAFGALMLVVWLAWALFGVACSFPGRNKGSDPAATLAAVKGAHDQYVAAINSNRLDAWLPTLTEDVVYLVPNRPAIVGKANVGAWAAGYLEENTTEWNKSVEEFVVSGDWAFGRYTYRVSDTLVIRDSSVDGGGTANDSGWGLVIYHHEPDGQWRVARDAWGSERAAR
jgi:ketosteroid isomerase-like protein